MIRYQGVTSGRIDIKCNPEDVRTNATDISVTVAWRAARESSAGGNIIMLSIITGCILWQHNQLVLG